LRTGNDTSPAGISCRQASCCLSIHGGRRFRFEYGKADVARAALAPGVTRHALPELPQHFRAWSADEFAADKTTLIVLTALPDHHLHGDADRFGGAHFYERAGGYRLVEPDSQAPGAAIHHPAIMLLRLWFLHVEDDRDVGAASSKSAPPFGRFVILQQYRLGNRLWLYHSSAPMPDEPAADDKDRERRRYSGRSDEQLGSDPVIFRHGVLR